MGAYTFTQNTKPNTDLKPPISYVELYERFKYGINIQWGNGYLNVFPASNYELCAEGFFPFLSDNQDGNKKFDISKCSFLSRNKRKNTVLEKNKTDKNQTNINQNFQDPHLYIFKAENGECTLLSWKGINILIDGGNNKKNPCFWDVVQTLKTLDAVILTHGDCDHVNGLLSLFYTAYKKQKDFEPKIKNLIMLSGTRRSWLDAAYLYTYANEMKKSGMSTINIPENDEKIYSIPSDTQSNNQIIIKNIWPDKKTCTEAKEEMKKAKEQVKIYRGPTLINKSSQVSHIICESNSVIIAQFLFTGDADGKDIASVIPKVTVFDYVDMPHHGSDQNNPKDFLDAIKTKNIGINTNGKYSHPSAETLKYLGAYLEKKENENCRVYFNYEQSFYGKDCEQKHEVKELIDKYNKEDKPIENRVFFGIDNLNFKLNAL